MTMLLNEARKLRCIRDVMVSGPYSVQDEHPLVIAERLMEDKGIRHLPVFRQRKLIGVLSERDLLSAIHHDASKEGTVGSALLAPPIVAAPEDLLCEVVRRLAEVRADVACIVDRDRLVGVFTTIDALRVLAELLEADRPAAVPG